MEQSVERPEPFGGRATELVGRRWRYDAAGRPTAIDDDRWGATTYGYDPLGQLIEAKRGGYHEVFEYDVTGSLQNILSSLDQVGQVAPWKLEPGNVLTEREGVRYENDRNKRRVLKVERGDGEKLVTSYAWDVRDRLREVGLPDGRRLRFRYDAFARRVSKELLPATGDLEAKLRAALNGEAVVDEAERTRFVWDGDVLAAEVVRSQGAVTSSRVHVHEPGSFVPLMQGERGEVFVVVNDHLGMPKELVDAKGRIAWAAAHSAWGRVLEVQRDEGAAEVSSPFRLLGQYADEETGLCYTRFRYFDAEAGRWCSADPIGLTGGVNVYAFSGAPTKWVDLIGLTCKGVREQRGRTFVSWKDADDDRFFFTAEVDDNGILKINARTRIGDESSANIRGGEYFDKAVAYFGDDVKGIEGKWHFGTNLDHFNKATGAGEAADQAAKGTWTGGKAAGHGFTEVTVDRTEGGPGNYSEVEVTFTKPDG